MAALPVRAPRAGRLSLSPDGRAIEETVSGSMCLRQMAVWLPIGDTTVAAVASGFIGVMPIDRAHHRQ